MKKGLPIMHYNMVITGMAITFRFEHFYSECQLLVISLTIPGPKMIWHFSDLGMENSLFTCSDGTVNEPDCKLDTKPQPQWDDNWLENVNRERFMIIGQE